MLLVASERHRFNVPALEWNDNLLPEFCAFDHPPIHLIDADGLANSTRHLIGAL